MKKNILSVLILVLLVVNIVLTGIMMFSVTSTNGKTAALVNNIAAAMNLELVTPGQEEEIVVSLADTVNHDLVGGMTIPLSGGERQSYIMFDVSLLLNEKGEGYEAYGATIADYDSLIKDAISSVVSKYTEAECRNDFEAIKAEMLKSIQDLFQADFVYKIAISGVKYG